MKIKAHRKKNDSIIQSNDVKVSWLSHVEEKMSLIALGIGMGIGFGGVIIIFMLWEKAKHWIMLPNIPENLYGLYRFPT